eukprot:scaffold228466_cov34-Prasinocladus_malaysianus.AAC.1
MVSSLVIGRQSFMSNVNEGCARAIVIAVGENSQSGIISMLTAQGGGEESQSSFKSSASPADSDSQDQAGMRYPYTQQRNWG